ncbi:ROK family protein [Kitasatospora sp. NPDC059327]|uniref:ROK family transcriptional regulator n=1 Tax=Kitasatospora sp. NPDC059327 TaxID=3346803 RepID=UPI003694A51C
MNAESGVFSTPPGHLLQLLLDGAPRTRAQLTAETGLARSTVRARLDALVGLGLVGDHADGVSTGGRPPGRFAFNPRARTVLAAEVGATHAVVAATDLNGAVHAARRLAVDVTDGPEPVLAHLLRSWRDLLATDDDWAAAPLAGLGLGLPGPVEHSTGRLNRPPLMPGWDGFDVCARIRADFDAPVLVDNEVNLMALGEHTSFPGVDDMIVVKVATGIGAGFISNGALHRGAAGAAGDLGHITAPRAEDTPCRCGDSGCLEAVASGTAVAAALRAKGLEARTAADVVSLVRMGNAEAGQAVRQAGRTIGDVLAGCVSMFNPAVIVVGGALAEAGDMLLAGVRESVYRHSLPLATESLRIMPAQAGANSGVIGAAAMVAQHVLSPAAVNDQLS